MHFEMTRKAWLRLLHAAAAHEHKVLQHQPRRSDGRMATLEQLDNITRLQKAGDVRIVERL